MCVKELFRAFTLNDDNSSSRSSFRYFVTWFALLSYSSTCPLDSTSLSKHFPGSPWRVPAVQRFSRTSHDGVSTKGRISPKQAGEDRGRAGDAGTTTAPCLIFSGRRGLASYQQVSAEHAVGSFCLQPWAVQDQRVIR